MSSPDPKRRKMSSEVCIVLEPYGGYANYYYCVYILDFNQKDYVEIKPAIRFTTDLPFGMAFAYLNSTLFMFGGLWYPGWKSLAYSFSFDHLPKDDDTYDVRFDTDSNITKISSMASPKTCPRAVLIGSQICVFSTTIDPRHLDKKMSNFEMYDPDTDQWSSLPEPPIYASIDSHPRPRSRSHSHPESEPIQVSFYCVDNLKLFICTENHGSCMIDLSLPMIDRNWMLYDLPLSLKKFPYPQPFFMDGRFLFSPAFGVWDSESQPHQWCRFPPMNATKGFLTSNQAIVAVPTTAREGKERSRACVVETGGFGQGDNDCAEDSVIGLRLVEFDPNSNNKLTPTILNSRLFYFGSGVPTYDINIVGVFHM